MRAKPIPRLEQKRVLTGPLASSHYDGNNGAFILKRQGVELGIVASDGLGWEHVSVSTPTRTPTWEEMCFVKDLFWDEEETVIQYHPPKSDYVNCHQFCLHLWKPVGVELPRPPSVMVGLR